MINLENDRVYKMTPKGALAAALVELFPMSTITDLIPHAELVLRELADWGFTVVSEDDL